MKKIILTLATTISFCSSGAFAASVCLVSNGGNVVTCDGKQVGKVADSFEDCSLKLKALIERDYKIVSQSATGEGWITWTLVKP